MKMIEKADHIWFQDDRLKRHMAIITRKLPNDDIINNNYIGTVKEPDEEEYYDLYKFPNDDYIAIPDALIKNYNKRLNEIAARIYDLDPYERDDNEETVDSINYELTHDYIDIIEYLLDIIEK